MIAEPPKPKAGEKISWLENNIFREIEGIDLNIYMKLNF